VFVFDQPLAHRLKKRVGWTSTTLDCTERSCRAGESNMGSWLCDLCRTVLGTDVALINGGTIRSDSYYKAGVLTMRALTQMLPFPDPIVVITYVSVCVGVCPIFAIARMSTPPSVTGEELRCAIEAGVSKFPTLDGRFPQVREMCVRRSA
jgi:5'-nucleotidase